MIFSSLKDKILLSAIIGIVVIEGFFIYLNIRSLSHQIIEKTEQEAFNLSETIRLSIRNAMIKDRLDEYQRIIDDVAQRKGIVEVRIFNKTGRITVSSDRSKVGTVVDKQAEACAGCHGKGEVKPFLPSDSKTRIYHTEKGRLLGLINPIYNEPSCYSCHPKAKNVLGVLDIEISLGEFEKEKAETYNMMIISGALSVIILSFLLSLLFTRFVNRPIDRLLAATEKAAAGDLDQAVDIRSHDELGRLSESFNNMISELKSSHDALKGWAQTLEHRVQERTTELAKANEALRVDITERKRAETQLMESEERYRTAIEQSNDGVAIIRGDKHLYVNRRYLEIFGYHRSEEVIGKTHSVIVHPDDLEKVMEFNTRRLRGEPVPDRYECKGIRKDGTAIYIEISATRTFYLGEPVTLAYLRDITERKWAEAEREKLILELKQTLSKVKQLSGLLPICASCKKIRDDKGYWNQIEGYIRDRSEAEFSHGICPECAKKLYPQLYEEEIKNK